MKQPKFLKLFVAETKRDRPNTKEVAQWIIRKDKVKEVTEEITSSLQDFNLARALRFVYVNYTNVNISIMFYPFFTYPRLRPHL
jgi:hypothetical protein